MSGNRERERKSSFFVLFGGVSCPNTRVFKSDLLTVELGLKLARVFAEIVPQPCTVAPVSRPESIRRGRCSVGYPLEMLR
jgi:hypothetical protein